MFNMFRSKKKQKKETSTSESASSSYNEKTYVQTSTNGGSTSTVVTRQISQSSQVRSTEKRTFSVQHSNSSGSFFPQVTSGTAPSLPQTDTTPWALGTGSARSNLPLANSSRLPTTFPTSPRFSEPSVPAFSRLTPTYRSAFGPTTVGSYPSRSRPPRLPSLSGQNAAQDASITQSLPARNESIIPTYSNSCRKRGKALLINNIKFLDKEDERLGAEKDSNDLKELLRMMEFEIDLQTNLKGKEMLKKVEQFSKSNFYSHDISMVVIMSHGNNIVKKGEKLVRMKGGYTEISGIDNEPLLVDDIIEKFTLGNSHVSLKGKPKIFIFQCCRGEKDQEVAHDVAPIKKVTKEHSDMLVAFSTLPGFVSNRNPKTGSWYIQSICDVFKRHYKDFHVEEMLKIVDDMLSTKHPDYTQTSTYESRGFKRCYLHPRGP